MAIFVKAADMGSFSAVAEATGLSATMVGKHIQFLENRLGMRLLNRTTRRQGLTEFGRAYYDRCRLILAEAEAADALASDHLNVPYGTLRITMPSLLGRLCAAPLLYDLSLRYPSMRLDLHMDDHVVDLAAGAFDLAIRTGRISDRGGLMMRRLGSHRMVVCGSREYLAQHGAPRDLEALSEHRAVVYVRPGWRPAWRFANGAGDPLEVTPPAGMQLNDLAAVADAAVAGTGLAWLPAWLARPHLDTGVLLEVLETQPSYRFDNYAVWPQAKHLPLKLRIALDLLASALPERLT
jgi:DNA-binding transcriptional LysR family regulator